MPSDRGKKTRSTRRARRPLGGVALRTASVDRCSLGRASGGGRRRSLACSGRLQRALRRGGRCGRRRSCCRGRRLRGRRSSTRCARRRQRRRGRGARTGERRDTTSKISSGATFSAVATRRRIDSGVVTAPRVTVTAVATIRFFERVQRSSARSGRPLVGSPVVSRCRLGDRIRRAPLVDQDVGSARNDEGLLARLPPLEALPVPRAAPKLLCYELSSHSSGLPQTAAPSTQRPIRRSCSPGGRFRSSCSRARFRASARTSRRAL